MWSFIQDAQKTVFDVIAPALGPEGEIETAVLNGDMGGATRIAEQNRLMLSHVRTSYNKNMLHVACSRANNMEMIQYLLSCGVDLRGTTDNRETCLHFAARAGCMTTTRFLVENGISVTQKIQVDKLHTTWPLATTMCGSICCHCSCSKTVAPCPILQQAVCNTLHSSLVKLLK